MDKQIGKTLFFNQENDPGISREKPNNSFSKFSTLNLITRFMYWKRILWLSFVKSAGVVEYTDCTSAEG